MTVRLLLLTLALGIVLLIGSSFRGTAPLSSTSTSSTEPDAQSRISASEVDAFHEQVFRKLVAQDPEWASELRLFDAEVDPYGDRLTDVSLAAEAVRVASMQDALSQLRSLDRSVQSPDQLLATDVLDWYLDDVVRGQTFKLHDDPVDHLFGYPGHLVSFMTDVHSVRHPQEAADYVARLAQFDDVLRTLVDGLERRAAEGIVPPKAIVRKTLAGMRGFTRGAVKANTLYTTFERKLDDLDDLATAERSALLDKAERELRESVYPGYDDLIASLQRLEPIARDDVGLWSLPDGDAYYAHLVRHHTTTDLTPEAIHEMGRREVERIQEDMQAIFDQIGIPARGNFGNRIRQFWRMTRSDPDLRYPNSTRGRNQALIDYEDLIDEARGAARDLFNEVPDARVRVEPVPRHMQNASPGAFYRPPSLDGERAGTFFINLANLPFKPSMPTLAYHEAVPGHHVQLALQRASTDLPTFQRALVFTAHAEGWGLYAERLMREQGFYDSPVSQFENLWSELFRAARLVVDTGIHHERWSRDRAIDYMQTTLGTGLVNEIDRYIAMPGQALAYKVGELTILDLRERAREALGEAFDLKAFHDVVIGHGSLPLSLLEREVERHIDETRTSTNVDAPGRR